MAKPHRYFKNRALRSRDVGKVHPLVLPGLRRAPSVHRWITEERADGRFLARSRKMGVLLRDIDKKRGRDYGPAHLLPRGAKVHRGLEEIGKKGHRAFLRRTAYRTAKGLKRGARRAG